MKQILTYSQTTANYTTRERELNGKQYIIVPVVMMVEGVHNGSRGAVYHSQEQLQKNVAGWNGIPVTLYHPNPDNGAGGSANSPDELERSSIGLIFHARYDNGLKAEAWLNIERLEDISPDTLVAIREHRSIEVSVGMFTDEETMSGEWNGETYEAVASNYVPDHLALLPGERGACSWEDGCGIRTNKKGETDMPELHEQIKSLNKHGYVISLINNQEGFREIQELLQKTLDTLDTTAKYYYLEEVFDTYFVYGVHNRETQSQTLYRRGYSVNNGAVVLEENPVEVRRSVEYVTARERRTKNVNINLKNDVEMPNLCCEAKIDALIANAETLWSASHKEFLMTQEEAFIDSLVPKKAPAVQQNANVPTAEEAVATFKQTLTKPEDYLELMSEDMKVQFQDGLRLYKEKRETLVKSIMDNTAEGTWNKEHLETMQTSVLESIEKSIGKQTDYSGQAGGNASGNFESNTADAGILYPVGVK